MFNFLCVVDSYFQIDTSAEDEGEGWRAEKPFLTHHNHPPDVITGRPKAILLLQLHLFYVRYWSFTKSFNFYTSVCSIYLVQ